jgi:hypothetical protein
MAKSDRSSTLSPFQRFEALAKALFAVPKKEAAQADEVRSKRRKRGMKNAKI